MRNMELLKIANAPRSPDDSCSLDVEPLFYFVNFQKVESHFAHKLKQKTSPLELVFCFTKFAE